MIDAGASTEALAQFFSQGLYRTLRVGVRSSAATPTGGCPTATESSGSARRQLEDRLRGWVKVNREAASASHKRSFVRRVRPLPSRALPERPQPGVRNHRLGGLRPRVLRRCGCSARRLRLRLDTRRRSLQEDALRAAGGERIFGDRDERLLTGRSSLARSSTTGGRHAGRMAPRSARPSLRHLVETVTVFDKRVIGSRRSTRRRKAGRLVSRSFAALAEFERDCVASERPPTSGRHRLHPRAFSPVTRHLGAAWPPVAARTRPRRREGPWHVAHPSPRSHERACRRRQSA